MVPHAVEAVPFHFLAVLPEGGHDRGTHKFIVLHDNGRWRFVVIDVFPVDLAGFFLGCEFLVEGLAGLVADADAGAAALSPWKLITVTPSGRVATAVVLPSLSVADGFGGAEFLHGPATHRDGDHA
jgi:hypothetical protein